MEEIKLNGPGVTRTPGLQIRNLPLYPTELQAQGNLKIKNQTSKLKSQNFKDKN